MRRGDGELLDDIARYNRDDVRGDEGAARLAGRASARRTSRGARRSRRREPYELDTDELVEGLHAFPEHGPEASARRPAQLLAPRTLGRRDAEVRWR